MHKRGFTLIELLVVISIVSLLSSVVYASAQGAREKAQDTKKVTETQQVQKALNLYKETNGGYPGTAGVHLETEDGSGSYGSVMNELVQGGYLGGIPDSPDDSYHYTKIVLDNGKESAYFGTSSLASGSIPSANNCAVEVYKNGTFPPGIYSLGQSHNHVYGWWLNDPLDTYVFIVYSGQNNLTFQKSHSTPTGDRIIESWIGRHGSITVDGNLIEANECLYNKRVNGSYVGSQTVVQCPDVLADFSPNILEVHELYTKGLCTSEGDYCSCSL